MIRRLLVIAAIAALAGAACGGGGDDESEAVAQAISDSYMEGSGSDSPFTQDQADCMGTAIVDEMGVSHLAELGLSLDAIEGGANPATVDMPAEDVDTMMDAVLTCIDLGEMLVNEGYADANISDESAKCFAMGLNESELIKTMARSSVVGEEMPAGAENELTRLMVRLAQDCLTADELSSITGGG